MNSLRFFLFACVVALCLTSGCRNDSSQPKKEGVNLFAPKKNKDADKIPRTTNTELTRRISQALQQSIDPEEKNTSQAVWYFGMFLAGLAVVIAGLGYWQMKRKKQIEWELHDPMALVQELNVVHQLSEQEKRLMQELSAKNSLSSPLKLFVEPKFLLEALEKDSTASQATVRILLSKLFDITPDNRESSAVSDGTDTKSVYYSRGV